MKGQYLAVETVIVFGLGLVAAIGVITLFDQFSSGVLEDAEPKQAQIINSQIEYSIRSLKQADSRYSTNSEGYKQLDLPARIAGTDYSIEVDQRDILIRTDTSSYRNSLEGLNNYEISGSATGGDITVFKQGSQLEIRAR